MNKIKEKKELLWYRDKYLKIMLIALRTYQKTNNKQFYEKAQYFGREGEKCTEEIKRLSQRPDNREQSEKRPIPSYVSSYELAEMDFNNF